MNEQLYRDLDYCICRYNCYFATKRPQFDKKRPGVFLVFLFIYGVCLFMDDFPVYDY